MSRNPLKLTSEQYAKIEDKIGLTGDEDYAVVAQKRHGKINFSIHVFARQPLPKELKDYEETASRMKFRGNKAEIEGSSVIAAKQLYDRLIARAYDVRVGRTIHETLDGSEAAKLVPLLVKREAVREFLGGVMGISSVADDESETESASEED